MRILAMMLTLLLVACGTAATPDATGVPLAFGLVSFSGRDSVLAEFSKDHQVRVIEDSKLAAGDPRPAFSIYTVRVPNASDKGFSGELRLNFFNDRLMEVRFYPDDVSAYRSAMRADKPGRFDRYVETRTAEDYRGHWYVAWADKRLRDELDDWIERYA